MITVTPSRDEKTLTTIQTGLVQINIGQVEFSIMQANSNQEGIAIFCATPLNVHVTRGGVIEVVPLMESEDDNA